MASLSIPTSFAENFSISSKGYSATPQRNVLDGTTPATKGFLKSNGFPRNQRSALGDITNSAQRHLAGGGRTPAASTVKKSMGSRIFSDFTSSNVGNRGETIQSFSKTVTFEESTLLSNATIMDDIEYMPPTGGESLLNINAFDVTHLASDIKKFYPIHPIGWNVSGMDDGESAMGTMDIVPDFTLTDGDHAILDELSRSRASDLGEPSWDILVVLSIDI